MIEPESIFPTMEELKEAQQWILGHPDEIKKMVEDQEIIPATQGEKYFLEHFNEDRTWRQIAEARGIKTRSAETQGQFGSWKLAHQVIRIRKTKTL